MQIRKKFPKEHLHKRKNAALPFSTEVSDTGSRDCFIGEEAFTGAGMVKGKDGGASEISDSED
jgi:hypothetical protein